MTGSRLAPFALRPSILTLEDRTNPSNLLDGLPPVASDPPFNIPGYVFTNWEVADLQLIDRLSVENTMPIVGFGDRLLDGLTLGDPYPIRDPQTGGIAVINGWYGIVGLAPAEGEADGINAYRLAVTRDGQTFIDAGEVLAPSDFDGFTQDEVENLFSGSFWYDQETNRLLVYSTPVFGAVDSPAGSQPIQRIGLTVYEPVTTETTFDLMLQEQFGVILEADGEIYSKAEDANTETEVYGFRDPFIFQDPADGRYYMTFTANWAAQRTGFGSTETGDAGNPGINVNPDFPRNDGVVGLAVATDDTLTNWELLTPLFGAIGVNEQLELPHVVYENDLYYLFFATHQRTFIGEFKFDFPEALYGFYAASLEGPYYPLNGSSLVLANPDEEEFFSYAWQAVDNNDGTVTIFSFNFVEEDINPLVTIRLNGGRTAVVGYPPLIPSTSSTGEPSNPPGGGNNDVAPGLPPQAYSVGTSGTAELFGPEGDSQSRVNPFPGFNGEIRVATGDVTGDGVPDLIAAAGPGGGPHVKVFDGKTGAEVRSFFAYDPGFTDGVYVAAADLNGDGLAEIVTGAGFGGGPRVKVFDGETGNVLKDFFAFDEQFRGGVRVATGDVTGDGTPDVIAAAGPGGGPHVKVFDGKTGAEVRSFYAYDFGFTGGMFVTAADFDGDGFAEIVTSPASGGGPTVKVFSGETGDLLATFLAGDAGDRFGIRVGAFSESDGDLRLTTAAGPGGSTDIVLLDPLTGEVIARRPTSGADGGVFVG